MEKKFDIFVIAKGGGLAGQTEAILSFNYKYLIFILILVVKGLFY